MAGEETTDLNLARYSSELRSMRCEQSLLNKTDGSASFLQGNGLDILMFGLHLGKNTRHSRTSFLPINAFSNIVRAKLQNTRLLFCAL